MKTVKIRSIGKHVLYIFLLLPVFVVMSNPSPCLAQKDRCATLKADLHRLNSDPRFDHSLKNMVRMICSTKGFYQLRDDYNNYYIEIIGRHGLPVREIELKLTDIWDKTEIKLSPFLMFLYSPRGLRMTHWKSYKRELYKLAIEFCESTP